MISRVAIILCVLTAALEVGLVLAASDLSTPRLAEVSILLFVVDPQLALGLMASCRKYGIAPRFLLVAFTVMMVWGIGLPAVDCYRYHTDPDYRLAQRMAGRAF